MTQGNTENFLPLSDKEKWLAEQVVDISFKIHKTLGPGLLESVYEKCFCYEPGKRKIAFQRQRPVPIIYDELVIDEGLRIDILVENLVILELKAHQDHHDIWEAQLLSYLKLTQKRLGYILNFHVPLMKKGIKRMIN
jgi:GxxExxY protein